MNQDFQKHQTQDFIYYTAPRLKVNHLFTTKFGGVSTGVLDSLNLGFNRGDKEENVIKNYQIVCNNMNVALESVTVTKQVHRDEISIVTKDDIGAGITRPIQWESDALITNVKGATLAGFYADCVVTLLYDEVKQVIAVCHSGWRGTAHNILGKTAQKMSEIFCSNSEDIIAVVGPSIGKCHFETDEDVPNAMIEQMGDCVNDYIKYDGKKYKIDLQGINIMNLKMAGLKKCNIIDSGICTYCNSDEFWSHRKTNGQRGVQGAFITL